MDPWYEENLVCPVDHFPLRHSNSALTCSEGHDFLVVDGVPVMLLNDVDPTLRVATASLRRATEDNNIVDKRAPRLYLESLGISEDEKKGVVWLQNQEMTKIDPVVLFIIAATNGITFKHLIGKLDEYPIPELRLQEAKDKRFLDLGCNWGRWSIAASQKGYSAVGIDPSLGAIMAARRTAEEFGLPIKYLVGDARYLPFKDVSFDVVFSYSVLQHFSKENVKITLKSAKRVLTKGGVSYIQMPNFMGIRCLQHQIKRRFRDARNFEVRYWSIPELKEIFEKTIGKTEVSIDCFFGLGLQESDMRFMPYKLKALVMLSELLRNMGNVLGFLKYVSDSVYVISEKRS